MINRRELFPVYRAKIINNDRSFSKHIHTYNKAYALIGKSYLVIIASNTLLPHNLLAPVHFSGKILTHYQD